LKEKLIKTLRVERKSNINVTSLKKN